MNSRPLASLALALAWPLCGAAAPELAPLESYGNLPVISSMAVSPKGDRIAYRFVQGDKDYVLVMDFEKGEVIGGVAVAAVKPRELYFLDEERVLMVVSDTTRVAYRRQRFENSTAFVFDVSTNELRRLLTSARDLWPAQAGLGSVVGRNAGGTRLYMPAFAGEGRPSYGLFEVMLDRRVERRKETEIPEIQVVGLTIDREQLVFESIQRDSDRAWHYHMSVDDGTVTGPFYQRDGADVETTLMDLNRIVYGVEYSGFMPTYEFADPELTKRVKAAQDALDGAAAELIDWTPSFDRLLFHVSGGWSSGDFVIAGRGFPRPERLVRGRPDIATEQVEPTSVINYAARDGVTIPALLTYDREAVAAGNKLPLIVLPHGGPAAHDRFGFDWIAQYFASCGFVVLQPQFRGSTGFGQQFFELGKGEWGAKMSTDLDDGVQWLIHRGVVDPDRIAVVGASYGGYAALAAGAFSPLYYKCIVSIAGISDLPRMLKAEKTRYGKESWDVEYWRDQFGSDETQRDKLEAISPVEHAEDFRAPVLLVHGKDDTVVEIDQSERMYRALKRADKDVTFIRLDGEDHWLSSAETRLEALKAVADFLRAKL